jgi:hypothetical protein
MDTTPCEPKQAPLKEDTNSAQFGSIWLEARISLLSEVGFGGL